MNNDRRLDEASSLRRFFDDQIQHLQRLANSLSGPSPEERQQAEEDRRIVESLVDGSNRKMRAVSGYSHKLREHVRALYNHVHQVADEIPPPVELSRAAFGSNPLVNALFADSNDIEALFRTDLDASSYLREHHPLQVPVMYALLTANKSEKRILGVRMQGDMVIHDVPQQAVNFSLHKIHAPCAGDAELGAALKQYLFGRVVELIKQDLAARMNENPFAPVATSYEACVNGLTNPDVYLAALIEYLQNPAKLLSIEKTHLKLSKLGIKLDSDDRQCANEFDIHELHWSDGSRSVALQISHPR